MVKKYDGQRGGYDYRTSNTAGTYNLYKQNKFVKQVDVETFINLKKDDWFWQWHKFF